MSIKRLSVFFPAYNEEGNIANTTEKAVKVLEDLKLEWEVLIINDGSKDQTGKVADQLAAKDKRIKAVHQPNGGYGTAMRAGFANAQYDWIVYTDGDGQFDFHEVTKFLELTDQADYIVGYRIKRADPFYRLIFAKIWAISVWCLFGVWVNDLDCGFKMIHRSALDKIGELNSTRGAMVNAELLIRVKQAGFRVKQVGVNHYPRLTGQPTGANLRVIIRSFWELFKFRLATWK